MSGDERDAPLSDDLRALLDAGRELDPLPPQTAERLLRGVDRRAALGGGAAPAHPGPWRRALAQRVAFGLVTFALGALAGTLVERWRHPSAAPVAPPPRVVYVDRPVAVPTPVVAPAPSSPSAPVEVAAPGVADAGPPARVVETEPDEDDLASEQATLELARSALRAGRPDAALEALHRHARRHPHGQLVPEREALKVRCLAALHRDDEARRTAERFLRRYPDSPLRPSVEAALQGSGDRR